MTTPLQLITPTMDCLPEYAAALKRGWSPDNVRGEIAAREQQAKIESDAPAFVAQLADRSAKGPPIELPDGSTTARLPGFQMWMWDGEFCGSIGFRWQPGTATLPPYCLGHIGYAVVPWKQRRGYATRALELMLVEAGREGLPYVDVTTTPDNVASQRVIAANGGVMIERFEKLSASGGGEGWRYRIALHDESSAT